MRTLLLAFVVGILAAPALAQPVSFETPLVKGGCRFIDDDGEVGHYALKRCPGLDGARVYTEAGVNTVGLYFRWGRQKYPGTVIKSDSLGLKLEWRGTGAKAAFKPYATIVTAVIKHVDQNGENEKRYNVLAVMRMEQRNACLMALIDEAGNKNALALARSTADAEAPKFSCAKDKPRIVGEPSYWAQQVIGFGDESETEKEPD
jgi:hypothetical protein